MTPSEPVDLSNCDREPIHIPGAIQPHGVLLGCRGSDLVVAHVSDNLASHLGIPPDEAMGRPVRDLLSDRCSSELARAAATGFAREVNPLAIESRDGRTFDGIVHRSATTDVVILELEPRRGERSGFHPRARASMLRLQAATDIDGLCAIAAEEVRALTGFDRVMVYRFDADWNGEVVAEVKRDDLEPFLGLHYPSADIPAQARRLYALNWLRLILDVHYRPSPVVPGVDPAGTPLDLSFSVLRSVSPIHIEYLTNMGVTASMSVSLVRDEVLTGLIACHHYSGPHHVSFVVRETCEFLAQALSWHLTSLEGRAAAERALLVQRSESHIVASIATAPSVPDGVCIPALMDLTASTGAALIYEGRVYSVGKTPAPSDIMRIVKGTTMPPEGWLLATDKLSETIAEAAGWEDSAAGVMVLEISRELGEYVLWFRPANDRTVNWGGDPRKVETVDAGGVPRLSPRGSFALWREAVRGRSLPWEPWAQEAARNLRRSMLGGIRKRADELRVLSERLVEADRMKDEFLATVGHELRTPLNAIVGWLHILKQSGVSPDRSARAIETIERNAHAQARLVDDLLDVSRIISGKMTFDVKPMSVGTVVERAIEAMRPAADAKSIRIQSALDSTAMVLGDATRLQQVMTNLLSNAVKFTPKTGRVQVFVERRESSVDLSVADTGCGIDPAFLPHVFERFRQADGSIGRRASGLGLGLAIVRHIVELHGGTVSVQSEGEGRGSTFIVRLPLSVAVRRTSGDATPLTNTLECPPELAGLRILIVEDDEDAGAMIRAMLEDCQAEVAVATSADQGLELVERFRPEVIVSDIGLPERDGYWFIGKLRALPPERGGRTPAVALTAHARVEDRAQALYAGFNNHVPKPIDPIELFAVISTLSPGHRARPPESPA
jgi:two-component system, chemotaxis family, sensor kinase Cph1